MNGKERMGWGREWDVDDLGERTQIATGNWRTLWRRDYAAVAQRIRRTRLAHHARTRRKLLKEMLNIEIRPPISFHAWRGNMIETDEQASEFEEP